MRRPRLLASYHLRLAALCAALFLAATAAAFAAVYAFARVQMERQIDSLLAIELTSLSDELTRIGPSQFMRRIDALAGEAGPARLFVLVLDADGRILAGTQADPVIAVRGYRTEAVAVRQRPPANARLLGADLPGALHLVIGHEMWPVDEATTVLANAMGIGAVSAAVLSILLGVLVAWRSSKRVRAMANACERVAAGRIDERLPRDGSEDEYDRLAETVNAMLDRIEALVGSMQRVTAHIAHELRSPIARLRQRLELAQMRAPSPADLSAALESAIAESDAMLGTAGALLRIAQAESGAARAGFRDFDLAERLRLMLDTYGAVAEERGRSLAGTLPDALPFHGDPTLLSQAVANLIENALRHARHHVCLALEQGEAIAITVADDGPGVPEAERARVVEPFYRLATDGGGAGLGLSLVAAVAKLHGGTLDLADNAPGLRATLRLPAPARPAEVRAPP